MISQAKLTECSFDPKPWHLPGEWEWGALASGATPGMVEFTDKGLALVRRNGPGSFYVHFDGSPHPMAA